MRIAVVIPLYNGERFIRETIMSVVGQTRQPDELIVVDDGSTDGGAAIVEGMASEYPIKLLRKKNGGQSSARNLGVRHCSATHIALLDQDDVWYPRHLEELSRPFTRARTGTLGWSYSDLDEIDDNGNMVIRAVLRTLPYHHPKRNVFSCIGLDMFVLPSASLIAMEAFDAVGGFDERLSGYEDDDLFVRIFRAGFGNVFINRPLTKWRMHEAGASWSRRMAMSRIVYLDKLLEMFPDNEDRDRYIARDCLSSRFLPLVLGEYRKALRRDESSEIRVAWQHVRKVARLSRPTVRVMAVLATPVLGTPVCAKMVAPAVHTLREFKRWYRRQR